MTASPIPVYCPTSLIFCMPLLTVENLTVIHQKTRRRWFHYGMEERKHLDEISFEVKRGRCLGLVGEQASGKLPLTMALLRLIPISEGEIIYDGTEITALSLQKFRPMRRRMQAVFSDGFGQLTPGFSLDHAFREVLKVWHRKLSHDEIHTRIEEVMVATGLAESVRYMYPVELDMVERQLGSLARALLVEPEFLICHDFTRGMDAVEQAEVLNRVSDIREARKLTLMMVTDDLAVAHHMSEDIAVLHRGKILEAGETVQVVSKPEHDYTRRMVTCSQ